MTARGEDILEYKWHQPNVCIKITENLNINTSHGAIKFYIIIHSHTKLLNPKDCK